MLHKARISKVAAHENALIKIGHQFNHLARYSCLHAMKKILRVKPSSIGDVIHNLPAASDLVAMFPDSRVDRVVEESMAAIPALYRGVGESFQRWCGAGTSLRRHMA